MVELLSHELQGLLPDGWEQNRPMYVGLAEVLRAAIRAGEISPGARLPAERELAAVLAVSRSTIVGAYDALRSEGWLVSRTGSGTFAADRRTPDGTLRLRDMVHGAQPRSSPARGTHRASELAPTLIDLSISRMSPVTDEIREAIEYSGETLASVVSHIEYAVEGLPQLRQRVADSFTTRGLPTSANQIVITSGAQQALGLLTQQFVAAGDVALVESPTYLGAIDTLREHQARLVSLPASEAPLDVAAAMAVARRLSPALMFVMPTCHTVTGRVLDREQRAALAALSLEQQMPLVEDDIFADLTFAADAIPPVGAFAEDAPVFTVGSMSKLYWNGLRLGWLRAPEAMVVRLARLKGSLDLGTSLIVQLVADHLLEPEPRARVAQARLGETQAALALARQLLRRRLPRFTYTVPAGGRSLWCRLPSGSASELAAAAERQGVRVLAGPQLCGDRGCDDHIRIMYVQRPAVLETGIERLARAWEQIAGPRR